MRAQPAGQQRGRGTGFASFGQAGLPGPDHAVRGFRRGRDAGRAVQRQYRVDAGGGEQHGQGRRVAGAVGIADDVDRVGARPTRRQDRVQRRDRGRVEFRQGAAGIEQRVGRQHAEAAAIGQDRQPVAVDGAGA